MYRFQDTLKLVFTNFIRHFRTTTLRSLFYLLRHGFVDERATITTTLTFSCHWKTLVPFCLRKERPEKAVLTLAVSYRKILQRNKLCH